MQRMEGDDLELVQRARAGDADAFRELVERHGRNVFRTAYRLTGSQENADEVVQETFLRVYRGLRRFDARSRFGTWLHRISVNCAMDLMRKQVRRGHRETGESGGRLAGLAAGSLGPHRRAEAGELGRAVATALRSLSAEERSVFVLRHFEGYTSVEIGRMLGMRPGAVRNAVFRAVRKLRVVLRPWVEE